MAANMLGQQILSHIHSKTGHRDDLASIVNAVRVTKKAANHELYRLQKEGQIQKLQEQPPVWGLASDQRSAAPRMTLRSSSHGKTRGVGRGRGAAMRAVLGGAAHVKNPKQSVNKDAVKKIFGYLQSRKRPAKSLEIARAIGCKTSGEVNATLYSMSKKRLILKMQDKPPTWCVQAGARLPGAGLPGAGLPGAGLPGAGLPGAGLPGAGLPGGGFQGGRAGEPVGEFDSHGVGVSFQQGSVPVFQDTELFPSGSYTEASQSSDGSGSDMEDSDVETSANCECFSDASETDQSAVNAGDPSQFGRTSSSTCTSSGQFGFNRMLGGVLESPQVSNSQHSEAGMFPDNSSRTSGDEKVLPAPGESPTRLMDRDQESDEEPDIPPHSFIDQSNTLTPSDMPPVHTSMHRPEAEASHGLPEFQSSFPQHAKMDPSLVKLEPGPQLHEFDVGMEPVMPRLSPQISVSDLDISRKCRIPSQPDGDVESERISPGLMKEEIATEETGGSCSESDRVLQALTSCPLCAAASFVIACKSKLDRTCVEELLLKLQAEKYVSFKTPLWVLTPFGEEYIKRKTDVGTNSVITAPTALPPRQKPAPAGPPPSPHALMKMKGMDTGGAKEIPGSYQRRAGTTVGNTSSAVMKSLNEDLFPGDRAPQAAAKLAPSSQSSSSSFVGTLGSTNQVASTLKPLLPSSNQNKPQAWPRPLMSLPIPGQPIRTPLAMLMNTLSQASRMPGTTSSLQSGNSRQMESQGSGFLKMNTLSEVSRCANSSVTSGQNQSLFTDPTLTRAPLAVVRTGGGGVSSAGNTGVNINNNNKPFKPPATPADIVQRLKQAEISPRQESTMSMSYVGAPRSTNSDTMSSSSVVKTMPLSEFQRKFRLPAPANQSQPVSLPVAGTQSGLSQYGNQSAISPFPGAQHHAGSSSLGLQPQSVSGVPVQHAVSNGAGMKLELNLESFRELNKNPVSALMEYAQSRKQVARVEVISQRGSSHKPVFQMAAFIDSRQFPAITCSNKKDGRKEACDVALRQLAGEGLLNSDTDSAAGKAGKIPVAPANMTHFDKMAALTHRGFTAIASQITVDCFAGRKVIAGLVMKRSEDDVGMLISLGSGNRCITGPQLSLEGNTVNDSHAEIITRRGFIRFLYKQLLEYDPSKANPLLEKSRSGKLQIRPGITFHLYISTAPCGDAAIFCPRDAASNNTPQERATHQHTPTFSNNVQGVLRTKVEAGEGTIPIEAGFSGQTWDGIMRGERLRTMSCTDKICRWNVVGLQGALLSHFLEPVYLESLTLGFLYDHGHLSRAVCCRVGKGEPDIDSQLPRGYRLNHPCLGRVTVCDPPRETQKTKAFSINWTYSDDKPEITDGTLGLCNTSVEKGMFSRCSKKNFYESFKKLCARFGRTDCLEAETYKAAKMMAKDFQMAKGVMLQRLKGNKYGMWVSKPPEEEMFS